MHGSQVTVDHVGWPYRPEGLTSAQLNLPFCVATLLLEGDVFVDQFKPEAVDDRARIALSRKVEVVHDPAITALGSAFRHKVRVEVHLRDGTRRERDPRSPARQRDSRSPAADEIVDKFRKLTRGAISEVQQDALIEGVLEMEQLPTSRRLAELLRQQ